MSRRMVLAMAAIVAACAAPPPPPPATLELTIAATPDQNPDPSGRATPVAVRLYQLTGSGRFEHASMLALSENEAQTLGDQSVGSEEILVKPGETRTIKRELKPGVQFLGAAVLFRDVNRAHCCGYSPVAPHGPTKLILKISGDTATLAPS
jgi:type VI secretion system protein VasD